ncbi:NAD(P)/FAD-dependent oxidoreductase [Paraburkholderia sp.]|uniref:flavin-containing monooxygenase n=1 Tax=Paraburkholderia sp. TaxID=1926495 RepID=UPI002D4BE026|nr:NAD(P)/FAD-dependent oxidoreductase [Paraburkholderia sp.]HZZ02306.1 NAD(P)/FAD-dependent oxidoreductase [Paraburkholderia sp.]
MENFDVLIIGAGVSGVGMACALSTECPSKTYAILERRERLGGTWDLFDYPGVRSDSDMLTYGYRFRPWQDAKVLAAGQTIRDYLAETAKEYGVDRHIRYGLKISRADWSQTQRRWTVTAISEASGETRRFSCAQLVMSTGYYNYDAGYTPAFPGIGRFAGEVVHPQHWPKDIELGGKRVVVVGSGATAITLVPNLARLAAHVTMLQRSPTYVLSVPSRDALTEKLSRIMPRRWAFALARRRNTALAGWIYKASRKWPHKMRNFLIAQAGKHLGSTADMAHFTPAYMPWDQRLCIVPDADLFKALRSGKASVVTDHIAGFDGTKIVLRSGAELEADVLITATGLNVQVFGGTEIFVDGERYEPRQHMLYKGVLLEGLPNFAWIVGYTNLSWTLKSDLAASYLCRLYKHMDDTSSAVFRARDEHGCRLEESVMGNLTSGYITRAKDAMPRQGRQAPWRVTHHYPSDKVTLLDDAVDDGILSFERQQQEVCTR